MKNIAIRFTAVLTCILLVLALASCSTGNAKDIFAVEYNGQTITLGEKADGVLRALGEPESEQNSGNCGGLGETIVYDYPALKLTVVDYEDGDAIIDKIELKTDTAETVDGIYIGADEDKVVKAYGDGESSNGALVYSDDGKEMAIGIKNGKVTYIIMFCD